MSARFRVMTVAQQIRYKAERIAAFVAAQRKGLRDDRPLLVSMQGPQGCGEFSAGWRAMRERRKYSAELAGSIDGVGDVHAEEVSSRPGERAESRRGHS